MYTNSNQFAVCDATIKRLLFNLTPVDEINSIETEDELRVKVARKCDVPEILHKL